MAVVAPPGEVARIVVEVLSNGRQILVLETMQSVREAHGPANSAAGISIASQAIQTWQPDLPSFRPGRIGSVADGRQGQDLPRDGRGKTGAPGDHRSRRIVRRVGPV